MTRSLLPLLLALTFACDKDAEDTSAPADTEDTDAEDIDTEDTGDTEELPVDADGDGYDADSDCDDDDAAVNPDAEEVCDEIDNNCDGEIDEGVTLISYADADADGFGDADSAAEGCEIASGYVEDASDCDDAAADVHPGAVERCDGIDNDCDSETGEDGIASFFDGSGVWSDVTDSITGEVTLEAAGTLYLCAGTWDASLTIAAPVDIIGAGPEQTVIDNGGAGTIITVEADVGLSGLALSGGVADAINTDYESGGAVYCDNNNTVTAEDLLLSGNSAELGGALYAEDCTVDLADVELSDNSADYGGAINFSSGDLSITDSLISGNSAATSGGGMYSGRTAGATITITGTDIQNNTALYGGGLLFTWAVEASFDDSSFLGNSADIGSAIMLYSNFSGSLVVTDSDFGEDGASDDNTGDEDVYHSGESYSYGDGVSFSCDSDSDTCE